MVRRWNGWGEADVRDPLRPSAAALLVEPRRDRLADRATPRSPRSSPRSPPRGSPPARASTPTPRPRPARPRPEPARLDRASLRAGSARCPTRSPVPTTRDDVRDLLGRARRAGWAVLPVRWRHERRRRRHRGRLGPAGRGGRPRRAGRPARRSTRRAGSRRSAPGRPARPSKPRSARTAGRSATSRSPASARRSAAGSRPARRAASRSATAGSRTLFAGGHVETPAGPLDLPALPASAAGPDLRELVLGSEGRLGIITDVVVRTVPTPAARPGSAAYSLPGLGARRSSSARRWPSRGLTLSMVRVSTPLETATTLALAPTSAVAPAAPPLPAAGAARGRERVPRPRRQRRADARRERRPRARSGDRSEAARGVGVPGVGDAWRRDRFAAPYLRNALWDAGYAVDTLETAADWSAPARPRRRARAGPAARPRRPTANGSTPSATCRTSTRRVEPVRRPTSSARPPTRTRRSSAGGG